MANRNYGEVNPNNSGGKNMGGTKNDDGREEGSKSGSKDAAFEKVLFPNQSVPALPKQDGAE